MIAKIYEDFTKHVEYDKWYKLLRKYFKKSDSILDVGCGTGRLSSYFEKDDFILTAIDIDSEMVEIAKNKYKLKDVRVHDILGAPLLEKFKYICANFDTVNYFKDIERFISNCSSMQKDGGILVFDIVGEGIFSEIFENDIFIDETDSYLAFWYHEKISKYEHKIDIDLFYNINDDKYRRIKSSYIKYIHKLEYIEKLLSKYSYTNIKIDRNDNFGKSRIYIISEKVAK